MKVGGAPNLWKGAHPATGLKVSHDKPVAQVIEPKILDQAGELISKSLASFQQQAAVGGDGKAAAPPSPSKKGELAASLGDPSSSDAAQAQATFEAQRSILKFRASLLMSQLDVVKGQPLKALASADAALETFAKCASLANLTFDDNDEAERYAVSSFFLIYLSSPTPYLSASLLPNR